jgi:hypothetical protein
MARAAGLAWVACLAAQTPDATLQGVVWDPQGRPVPGVQVTIRHEETALVRAARTGMKGEFSLAGLPRGRYRLQLEHPGYRTLAQQGLQLAVGEKREQSFTLAATEEGQGSGVRQFLELLPPAPGLAVETTASSVSVVVEEDRILSLPLATRNIYSLFLLQPGVTSQGAVVRRGLSFSVHGQRVSGSNYLLDGVDNNNVILTGPLAAASAEAVQEFRMVNSSFSAETGRATAFVAQVASRAGGNRFHGRFFEFLANDRLNANTFANNTAGRERSPLRRHQFGYSLQGPLRKNRSFFSSAVELSRVRSASEIEARVPSAGYIAGLPAGSIARQLLLAIPPAPGVPAPSDPTAELAHYLLPARIDTLLSTQRWDHHFAGGQDRVLARYTVAATRERTDRAAPGYPSLQATDSFGAHNTLLGWNHSGDAGAVNDLRIGWSRERLRRPRPRSDLPVLQTLNGVSLPSSRRQFDEWENNNVVQFSDQLALRGSRTSWIAGLEYRRAFANSRLAGINSSEALGAYALFPDGFYSFRDLAAFAAGQPQSFSQSVERGAPGPLRRPSLERYYRSADWAAFLQSERRLRRRLSLNAGLRYEYFGAPHNRDRARDVNFYFGPGATLEQRLAAGVLRATPENPGDLRNRLYHRDAWNFAPSLGLAWDPRGHGRTVFRAGYALALDRIFDAARDPRTNTQQQTTCLLSRCHPVFSLDSAVQLGQLPAPALPGPFVVIDQRLRTPYVQNWYAGLQHTVTPSLLLELGHAGSAGRKLLSRDNINRAGLGRVSSAPIVNSPFLSNAGNSNYLALEAALRRRFSGGLQFGISYTYSHAIDNQSDIVEGIRIGLRGAEEVSVAAFTRPFDSRVDRGSANFDQRQNLVLHALWDLPRLVPDRSRLARIGQGWTLSLIGAYRSGFPVTLLGFLSTLVSPNNLLFNRVDFVGSADRGGRLASPVPVPGGVQWLDRSAFRPAPDRVGTLGRGAVPGPGFWNHDLALIRHFRPREGHVRLQFRIELYNLLNHANLSPPVPVYVEEDFGRAYYGRARSLSRFGELPLDSPARRVQLALRLHF